MYDGSRFLSVLFSVFLFPLFSDALEDSPWDSCSLREGTDTLLSFTILSKSALESVEEEEMTQFKITYCIHRDKPKEKKYTLISFCT